MRNLTLTCLLILGFVTVTLSQKATITGVVKDGNTGEPLESATVVQPPSNGVITDIAGNYQIQVEPGEVTLIIGYIGLTADTVHLNVKAGQQKVKNILLTGTASEMQTVVVTENRIGEKIQKATQSVDVMKIQTLENNNITNMQNAVTKMTGVTVMDGQMSVRGGSGYAYGAGSRVTLVVDGMPLMTADRQDIKWPFVPIENVEQIELVKGASSVQYGASALNGVLSVTTAYARDTPITKLGFFYEGYQKPKVDSFVWWKRDGKFFQNPNRMGMNFLHSEKLGDFDLVIHGMLMGFQSYLQSDYSYYSRIGAKLRWHPRKLNRFTLELVASTLYDNEGFGFYWQDAQHPYITASGVSINTRFFYGYMDPKINYIDKKGNEHQIYGRLYMQSDYGNVGDFQSYALYYRFRHDFGRFVKLMAGVNNEHTKIENSNFGGVHFEDHGGLYIQAQVNYKFFTLNFGGREEYRRLDNYVIPAYPVFRLGASFEARKYNYIRASFGQAYRYPSIVESFVTYQLGSLEILPNPNLLPERGFTAELGYKRTFKIGNWFGYVDASTFWTEFKNMIEFTFGTLPADPPVFYIPYFQSQNVSHARIFGWEFELAGEGHLAPNAELSFMAGYTYFYGVNVDDKAAPGNKNPGTFLKNAFESYILKTNVNDNLWNRETAGMLKYRNPHQFKLDADVTLFNKYHLGTALIYLSYMSQIDGVFGVAISGVDVYRQQHRNKGDAIWDVRCGYDLNRNIRMNFMIKNILNSYTVVRVARPDAPRSFTVQLLLTLGGSGKKSHDYSNATAPGGGY